MLRAAELAKFILANRDELIRRCQAKVAQRSSPPPTASEIDHGVPLFLEQIVDQLKRHEPHTLAIRATATQHGRDLFVEGLAGVEEPPSAGQLVELRHLLDTAITAFEVLQTGNVGINGNTGTQVHRSLLAMRSLI